MSDTIITKTCHHYNQIKPISQFCKDKSFKDGYRCLCKACKLKYNQSPAQKQYHKRLAQTSHRKEQWKKYRQSKSSKELSKQKTILYLNQHPDQAKAYWAVKYAVKIGKLAKPKTLQCSYCPEKASLYHHNKGYGKEHRLDVIPVCPICHMFIHAVQSS
jgi:hypothetical protein